MTKALVRILLAVTLIGTGVLAYGALKARSSNKEPNPPPAKIDRLESSEIIDAVGIDLEPPPADLHPAISGELALATGWANRPPDGATAAEASLALFGKDGKPVWRVRYTGVCYEGTGGGPGMEAPPCNKEYDVLIDATTGGFMVDYSYR